MSDIQTWTLVFVIVTFSIYIFVAYRSRVSTTLKYGQPTDNDLRAALEEADTSTLLGR